MKATLKSTIFPSAVAAALLGLAALAQAQGFERGQHWEGGGRWGGAPPPMQAQGREGWREQHGRPQRVYPQQQAYPQPAYPQGRYQVRPMPQGPGVRGAPPAVVTMPPQYAPAPQYAPQPQYMPPPPPPRWNHARGFRPGDALPPEYRQRQFIVHDWRGHRLYAPPPGYVWIQPEPGSYLLIGNNGVIANMLVGQ